MGKHHRPKPTAESEEAATRALGTRADALRNDTGGPTLAQDATIVESCLVFSHDKAHSCPVEDSTMDAYQATGHNVIIPPAV